MKKIKSKTVCDYVMNDMVWKVDLPSFLKEIAECSKSVPYSMTFKISPNEEGAGVGLSSQLVMFGKLTLEDIYYVVTSIVSLIYRDLLFGLGLNSEMEV